MRRLALLLILVAILFPPAARNMPKASAAPRQPKVAFGAYVAPRYGEGLKTALQKFEKAIGRRLAAVRVYYKWDTPFPNTYAHWLKRTNHTIVMSVKAKRRDGSIVKWAQIANARKGSTLYHRIVLWAQGIKRFGDKVYFAFNHEPEARASDAMGTAKEFKAAWRRIVTVFQRHGVRNARYLWTMTDYSFQASDDRKASRWYPGDRYVHAIGGDAYNWYHCRSTGGGWESLADNLRAMRRFGKRHPNEILALPEWGSVEDWSTSGRKANWLGNARRLLKRHRWHQFKMILYFHSKDQTYDKCQWWANTTTSSLYAFRKMANDRYYKRRV